VHLRLGQLGVSEHLLDRVHALAEVVHVHILESGSGDHTVEVSALEQRIYLDVSLGGG
jgi:hypothetical protein